MFRCLCSDYDYLRLCTPTSACRYSFSFILLFSWCCVKTEICSLCASLLSQHPGHGHPSYCFKPHDALLHSYLCIAYCCFTWMFDFHCTELFMCIRAAQLCQKSRSQLFWSILRSWIFNMIINWLWKYNAFIEVKNILTVDL